MIAIIDYRLGNVQSVANAFDALGVDTCLTSDADLIQKADALVLPGVGAAGQGMQNLRNLKLDLLIGRHVERGKPILGICLGMQLLFTRSAENDTQCLNLIKGEVIRFTDELKVPHIGWNKVKPRAGSRLFEGIESDYFYFANSYYCQPEDKDAVTATTEYGRDFCSSIEANNIYGTQFHPEKSSKAGLQIWKNFVNLVS